MTIDRDTLLDNARALAAMSPQADVRVFAEQVATMLGAQPKPVDVETAARAQLTTLLARQDVTKSLAGDGVSVQSLQDAPELASLIWKALRVLSMVADELDAGQTKGGWFRRVLSRLFPKTP